jgi:tetratricopeptide (TPR) repeat protein
MFLMRNGSLILLASWWLWPSTRVPGPAEAIEQGLSAFARGDLAAAETVFQQAAESTNDPGLVAFNQAVVAFHQGHFRIAEQGFTCCLADDLIPPDRKVLALYNRGVCWLKLGKTAANYRAAIADFSAVLTSPEGAPELLADARHNLELAKLFWAQAVADQPRPEPGDGRGDAPPGDPDRNEHRRDAPSPEANPPGTGRENPNATPQPSESSPLGEKPLQLTRQLQPGRGNRPVLDDHEKVTPLSPAETRQYLQQIAERLERDRITQSRLLTGTEQPHVLDW